ncbi:MAG: GNAT family N-acetyltransferase [Candidatus Izemoplasmataceae bacterium]
MRNNKVKIDQLFNEYPHNRPIIFACLEGQYLCELIEDEDYVILFTPFDYHYVAGKVPSDEELFLTHITEYIKNHQVDEFVLFGPNMKWERFLEVVFQKIHGVIDARYLYRLDEEKYQADEQFHECIIEEIDDDLSNKPLLQVTIKKGNEKVSFATALMVGDHQAEIDVYTKDPFRRMGLAYKVSKALIDELLRRKLVPNWCCWRIKASSQQLAKKLGFVFEREIKAFVWVKD